MTTTKEIRLAAKRYEDFDDCLQAAADDYLIQNDLDGWLEGWDLRPRWENDQREFIILTVPVFETFTAPLFET
jgi:hypothetical protein